MADNNGMYGSSDSGGIPFLNSDLPINNGGHNLSLAEATMQKAHRDKLTDAYGANALSNEYQAESQQQLQNYNRNWYPVIARYIQTVNNMPSTEALYQGRAANSVRQQYGNAMQQVAASDTNRGAKVGSGRFTSDILGTGMDEGSSLGRSTQAAKEGVINQQVGQLQNIARIGRGEAGAIGRSGSELSSLADEQAREDARAALAARQTYMNAAGTIGGALYGAFGTSPPPPTGYAASMFGGDSGGQTYNPPSGGEMFGIPPSQG